MAETSKTRKYILYGALIVALIVLTIVLYYYFRGPAVPEVTAPAPAAVTPAPRPTAGEVTVKKEAKGEVLAEQLEAKFEVDVLQDARYTFLDTSLVDRGLIPVTVAAEELGKANPFTPLGTAATTTTATSR